MSTYYWKHRNDFEQLRIMSRLLNSSQFNVTVKDLWGIYCRGLRVMTGMVCNYWEALQTSDDVVKLSLSKCLMILFLCLALQKNADLFGYFNRKESSDSFDYFRHYVLTVDWLTDCLNRDICRDDIDVDHLKGFKLLRLQSLRSLFWNLASRFPLYTSLSFALNIHLLILCDSYWIWASAEMKMCLL